MNETRLAKGMYWDKAWSIVEGCSQCSPGCLYCWAARMEGRFATSAYIGTNGVNKFRHWNGVVTFRADRLKTVKYRLPNGHYNFQPKVYAVWTDLFHEKIASRDIKTALETMVTYDRNTYLVLTKRPERIGQAISLLKSAHEGLPLMDKINSNLEHLWLGTSISKEKEWEKVMTFIRQCAGLQCKKLLSLEPMLDSFTRAFFEHIAGSIDLVILGCESGWNRRKPKYIAWLNDVIKYCDELFIPLFIKQWDYNGKLIKLPYGMGHKLSTPPWHI